MTTIDLLTFLKSYGLQGSTLIIILFIIYAFLKTNWVSTKITQLFDNIIYTKPSKINMSHIINHNMFNYIDFWIYSKVPTIKFSSEYRTIIFRKYLIILLMKYRDNVQQYISSRAYEKMDDLELWKSILSLINGVVYSYEKEMETANIPKVIIEKMKEKNNEYITLIVDLSETVCNSEYYESDNNLLKIYSIQNILLSILQNVIMNSVSVCANINGQLKGHFVIIDDRKIIENEEHYE